MRDFRGTARAFLNLFQNESGQATTEYILILSVVVLGASALMRGIIGAFDRGLLLFGGQLERNLKTGRTPAGIWVEE